MSWGAEKVHWGYLWGHRSQKVPQIFYDPSLRPHDYQNLAGTGQEVTCSWSLVIEWEQKVENNNKWAQSGLVKSKLREELFWGRKSETRKDGRRNRLVNEGKRDFEERTCPGLVIDCLIKEPWKRKSWFDLKVKRLREQVFEPQNFLWRPNFARNTFGSKT